MAAHCALIYKQIRLRSPAELRPPVCRVFTAEALVILGDIRIYCRDNIDSDVWVFTLHTRYTLNNRGTRCNICWATYSFNWHAAIRVFCSFEFLDLVVWDVRHLIWNISITVQNLADQNLKYPSGCDKIKSTWLVGFFFIMPGYCKKKKTGPRGFKLEQMAWLDDMWCMFMFTNYVFAVLPASVLWFCGSNRCTCARVTLLPGSSHFGRMFYCHNSYNSVRVIFEDETETNTKESKVHASVRHANCSHANSTVVRVCREGEESLAGQKTTPPSLSLLCTHCCSHWRS